MFTGRMLSLFVMTLVIFYPMGNVWAQTTTSPRATGTGFNFLDELFSTKLAITIPERNQAPEASLELNLNDGKSCQNRLSVNLDDTVRQLFRNTDWDCSVEYVESYSGNPTKDEVDMQAIRFILGTPIEFELPIVGRAKCLLGLEAHQGRLGEERVVIMAGVALWEIPVCASYDTDDQQLNLMVEWW